MLNVGVVDIAKQDNRYVYGLDLSLSCSGIVVFDLDTLQPRLITSIDTDANQEHGERLHTQREFMKKLIEKLPPEKIYIEKGFSKFAAATQALFKVVGVYNELLKDVPVEYFAPTSVKKVITGNGRCSKGELQDKILSVYPNSIFRNEDQSDAFGICITGLVKDGLMNWEV